MLCVKLSLKFYIVTFFLVAFTILGWYVVFSTFPGDVLMEGDVPMDSSTKTVLCVLLSVVLSSWSLSSFTALRQVIRGYAFEMDEQGIHRTATYFILFSLIFIVPVRRIPYDSITNVSNFFDIITITVNKNKIDVHPLLKPFVNKKYRFFAGFAKDKSDEIKKYLEKLKIDS